MHVYLFLKQARIGFKGLYEDVKFDAQFALGGENANGSNNDLGLLDFVADVPLLKLNRPRLAEPLHRPLRAVRDGYASVGPL